MASQIASSAASERMVGGVVILILWHCNFYFATFAILRFYDSSQFTMLCWSPHNHPMATESVFLCVQRIVHADHPEYDDAKSGVTRHYVRVAHGSGQLSTAVRGLVDGGVHFVDASATMDHDNLEMRMHAGVLKRLLVSALKGREEGISKETRKRVQLKEPPTVDELGPAVWCPTKASVKVRYGTPLLMLQYLDNEKLMESVNDAVDTEGEPVDGDSDEEEEGEEEEEEEEEEEDDEEKRRRKEGRGRGGKEERWRRT